MNTEVRVASALPVRLFRVRRGGQSFAVSRWFSANAERFALGAIAAISAFFGLFRIGRVGYANDYYAAAVKSMLDNWHAFFFVSFDAKGFVTVDKPPLGLWIQTVFAWVLGFHGWTILLPQALASIGSVLIVHHLVRRAFGSVAGVIAALALAVAPINVAASRNNTADCVLVFVLLLATWAVTRSLAHGSLRWFCLGMALVGLGFNIKMMQAYLVLPALIGAWILTPARALPAETVNGDLPPPTRRTFRNRLGGLMLGGLVLVLVSFSWATIVQLTPADQRPYIGSSDNNSVFNLIFGYNGINRLLPDGWSILGITNGSSATGAGGLGGGGGVGGVSENGPEGIFRLINTNLGGQIGWLVALALIGLVVAWGWRKPWRISPERLALVIWGGWLLTQATFFSVAGFYHRYYLSMLSPAIAALVGIGIVTLWRSYRQGGWRIVGLSAALVATAAVQSTILDDYPVWRDRLLPAIVIGVGISALGLLVARLRPLAPFRRSWTAPLFLSIGVLSLLIAPATWSGITAVDASSNSALPVAGPVTADGGMLGFGGAPSGRTLPTTREFGDRPSVSGENDVPPDGGAEDVPNFSGTRNAIAGRGQIATDSSLISYLLLNMGTADYLVAVNSANQASQIILDTGEPVMAMGGFSGSDPILTADSFATLVSDGSIRFVLSGGGIGFGGRGGDASVTSWIQQNCSVVPTSDYDTTGSDTGETLYDCQVTAAS